MDADRIRDGVPFDSELPFGAAPGRDEVARAMKDLRQITVSGQHLMVFEVAARHVSFKGAAGELGVTQPVVSRSVRQLEAALGVQLFVRGHRSVALTEAAEVLYEAVRGGYEQMYSVARRLRRTTLANVTLVCSPAHVHWYVVPRLATLQERHPDLALRVQVIVKYVELEPLGPEGAVLGIRSGERPWPGYECAEIALEEVYPVCNPQHSSALACGDDLEALSRERLIHEDQQLIPSVSWAEYFARFGHRYRDDGTGLRMTYYEPVIQTAVAGQGVALGWAHLADQLVRQGLLSRIGTLSHRTGWRFWLVWPSRFPLSAQAEIVRDAMLLSAKSATVGAVSDPETAVTRSGFRGCCRL